MLDGQYQRVDIPANARTAHKGLLQKRLEQDLCWIVPQVPHPRRPNQSKDWTELNWMTAKSHLRMTYFKSQIQKLTSGWETSHKIIVTQLAHSRSSLTAGQNSDMLKEHTAGIPLTGADESSHEFRLLWVLIQWRTQCQPALFELLVPTEGASSEI